MTHQPEICLIGGSGRSGTTILRRIFGKHPQIASLPEFRITIDPDGLLDFYLSMTENWSPFIADTKLNALRSTLMAASGSSPLSKYYRYALRSTGMAAGGIKLERKYTGIGISRYCSGYERYVYELIRELTDFTYNGTWTGQQFGSRGRIHFAGPSQKAQLAEKLGNFYRSIARSVCRKSKATHFIEDNTWNILHFNKLVDLLPEARLVHIYRDPRDVTASYMQQSWAPSDPVDAARFYAGIMHRWKQVRRSVSKHRFLEISLEELVKDPEGILRSIAAFWELEWHDHLLDTDLNRSNTGRWRTDIPKDRQEDVMRILTDYVDEYGYTS